MSQLVLLHGGGDDPVVRAAAFGPFAAALRAAAEPRVALVVCEAEEAGRAESAAFFGELLRGLGAAEVAPLFPTPAAPLTATTLADARPAALFICGGATPLYHQTLCGDRGWLEPVLAQGLPLAGTSAGAAILAQQAILGGWRAARGDSARPILFQGASEGLDMLTVRPGLGLAEGAVDVHASQWGTLLRLIHAVDLGAAPHGWAIDENTALVLGDGEPRVVGAGHVYRVAPAPGGPHVTVLTAG